MARHHRIDSLPTLPDPRWLGRLATMASLVTIFGLASRASAMCLPADPSGVEAVYAQVLAVPDAARPYAVVRCAVSGGSSTRYWIPLPAVTSEARFVVLDESWDELWSATAPRAVVRTAPTVGGGGQPEYDLEPAVAERLTSPDGPVLDGTVTLVEPDLVTDGLPESTAALAVIELASPPPADARWFWLPAVRLPLVAAPEGGGALLPVLPQEGFRVGEGGGVQIENGLLVLTTDRFVAPVGFDTWDAVDRSAGDLAASVERVAPNPVLVIPDLRRPFLQGRQGGFARFYEERVDEVTDEVRTPTTVLQYAGPIGDSSRTLPQPAVLASQTSGNRVLRARLDHATGRPVALTEIPPLYYRPQWVALPDNPEVTPVPPEEAELSGDSLLFRFGAELPSQLEPGLIRSALEEHMDLFSGCNPGATTPMPVDIQFIVEPGGTTLAVFVAVSDPSAGGCLIDGLTDLLFPLATGPPIAVRFPIHYGPP